MKQYDFIGFTYNNKHSIDDFGIYRVSDGSRYNDNLVPQLNDKTADIVGGDGQYFFGTTHKTRQFSISIAFDSLTESKYREMRQWLDGKEIHDLIFDEAPYKVYSAKVTGTPQLKTVCFNENGQRIYKGEGSIQFTCYYPYAHTPNFLNLLEKPIAKSCNFNETINCGLVVFPGWKVELSEESGNGSLNGKTIIFVFQDLIDRQLYKYEWEYDANLTTPKIGPNIYNKVILANLNIKSDTSGSILPKISLKKGSTVLNYIYTEKKCFEYSDSLRDGKNINHYCISDYPNKSEWALASNLKYYTENGENWGDLPASFILKSNKNVRIEEGTSITFGNCQITILETCQNIVWNSKNGLVMGEPFDGTEYLDTRPIAYSGISYNALEPGMISLKGMSTYYTNSTNEPYLYSNLAQGTSHPWWGHNLTSQSNKKFWAKLNLSFSYGHEYYLYGIVEEENRNPRIVNGKGDHISPNARFYYTNEEDMPDYTKNSQGWVSSFISDNTNKYVWVQFYTEYQDDNKVDNDILEDYFKPVRFLNQRLPLLNQNYTVEYNYWYY